MKFARDPWLSRLATVVKNLQTNSWEAEYGDALICLIQFCRFPVQHFSA